MYEIANYFIDASGVYFVRVIIDETQAQFFTFDHYPTQEEVDLVAQQFVDAQNVSTRQNEFINP